MVSCELERVSYNEISADNFYQNEDDVNKALTALYYPFRGNWGTPYVVDQYSYLVLSEFSAGIMTSRWTDQDYKYYSRHIWTQYSTGWVKTTLQAHYARYSHLTSITNVIRDIEASSVSQSLKDQAVAEANVLYAWMGYILYDAFGPVPIATEEALTNVQDQIYIPRLSDEEYTELMLSKLDYVIDNELLPVRNDDWGRTSLGMALMLKLKFLMINNRFEEAEVVARKLYSYRGSIYELQDSYDMILNKANAKNNEIIHVVPCYAVAYYSNLWLHQVCPTYFKGLDGTNSDDMLGGQTFALTWDFFDKLEEDDERRDTIGDTYIYNGIEVNKNNNSNLANGGPIPLKIGEDPEKTGIYGSTDMVIFRFADVMLTLAECINRNGGDKSEAVALVNEIRSRVGLKDLTAADYASTDALNAAILKERLAEFYMEGSARTDKIRFGTFVSDCQALYPDNNGSADYMCRFPIPNTYISESGGVVVQNPGY